ncbi:uncharacterized protein [Periplaneta americana]|uniref:uncharacterized protein n=1 Tax=Periplaneta americana TaxID=6978 RepID=UPI0037E916DB
MALITKLLRAAPVVSSYFVQKRQIFSRKNHVSCTFSTTNTSRKEMLAMGFCMIMITQIVPVWFFATIRDFRENMKPATPKEEDSDQPSETVASENGPPEHE